MRILYVKSAELIPYVYRTLASMGHEVEIFEGETTSITRSTELLGKMLEYHLSERGQGYYDFAISFNFFYIVSEVCQKHSLYYLSWIYDSPQVELYHKAIRNSYNLIFAFDKSLIRHLQLLGEANVFYCPLASDVEGLADFRIENADMEKYGKEVAFVGHMYEDNTYNRTVAAAPETVQMEMQQYLQNYLCRWNGMREWPALSKEATDYFAALSPEGAMLAYDMPLQEYFGCILLSRKLAEMERLTALDRLAKLCPLTIYTNSKSEFLDMIPAEKPGPVDYRTQMRKVFHLSRINLNFTMPSIETGVPLRVFDIMSVGGFCLTNAQEEVYELFEVGKEIEVFHDVDELCARCLYYLRHEDQRLEIAINGFQKVAKLYSYRTVLSKMLEKLEEKSKENNG